MQFGIVSFFFPQFLRTEYPNGRVSPCCGGPLCLQEDSNPPDGMVPSEGVDFSPHPPDCGLDHSGDHRLLGDRCIHASSPLASPRRRVTAASATG